MPQWARTCQAFFSSAASRPATVSEPEVGVYSAFISLARVDLPQPFAPSMASFSPFSTESDTPFRARCAASGYL